MKNQKKMIMALVLLLAVGFAAVTTTLLINGNALIGTTEFDVYFSSASIDGVENNALISQDGKSITYETANLQVAGDTSKLDYTITNNSSQYDAEVSITCDFSENDYVRLENSLQNEVIEAKTEKSGTLTATLIKTSTEERSQGFTCTIVANAVERDTVGEDTIIEGEVNTYSVYGTLTDEEGTPLANKTLVAYSDPVYTTTDENGYFYIEGLEKGSHTLYVIGSTSIDDVKELSEEEVTAQAVTKAAFTTNAVNIVFENGYSLENEIVEKTQKVIVTFTDESGIIETVTKEFTKGKDRLGELSTSKERDGYSFLGWFNGDKEITKDTIVNSSMELVAKWQLIKVYSDEDSSGTKNAGDIVTLGTESFYIVTSSDTETSLLSMYNLYVGGEYTNSTWTAYENPTGIQDSTMLGSDDSSAYKGVTAFSSDTKKGINYSDYFGSIVEEYVNNYVNYLNTNYNINATGRLLEENEYTGTGYNTTSYWLQTKGKEWTVCGKGTCPFGEKGTKTDIKDSTRYLLFTLSSKAPIKVSYGTCDSVGSPYCTYEEFSGDSYSNVSNYGVRPVITISSNLLN